MIDDLDDEPRRYFPGTWPDGEPAPGTPREAIYAAVFANYLRRLAFTRQLELPESSVPLASGSASPDKPKKVSLDRGMELLSHEFGIPKSTLRFIADGARWPTFTIYARVESRVGEHILTYGVVAERLAVGEAPKPAPTVTPRNSKKKASEP